MLDEDCIVVAKGAVIKSTSCADLIVHYLEQLGVDTVFGVPGGAIEPFMNALARSQRRGGPRLVVARHECGAAFMADGYYRETGKMGVVCTTTGPGATNLLTGVASAQVEQIPMLVITAQTPLPKFGKYALQESSCTAIDTVGIFQHVTRFSSLISHHQQLEQKLISSIMAAHRRPFGPVHLSLPSDVLRAEVRFDPQIPTDILSHEFSMVDDSTVNRLVEKIFQAKRIALYLGAGTGQASELITEFINLTGSEFVASPLGKTWINERHPLYRGVYGFAGHESAKNLIHNDSLELVIAVGTNLNELETSGWHRDLLNRRLIHIDSIAEHFTRSSMANLHVLGNIRLIFNRLLPKVKELQAKGKTWKTSRKTAVMNINGGYASLSTPEKCETFDGWVKPQYLMSLLSRKLPDNTRIFIDAGNSWSWATHYLTRSDAQGFYRVAMGYGSMTWAISAAIGSSIGNPGAPTLCIVGDGSYLMSAQEITVASQKKLPIIFLIMNDAAMGMVMHGQRLGQQESIGWELNEIDYASMAKAMNINGMAVKSAKDLSEVDFHELFSRKQPTLLDVHIDREEVPLMGDRVKGLASATPGG